MTDLEIRQATIEFFRERMRQCFRTMIQVDSPELKAKACKAAAKCFERVKKEEREMK